MNTRFLLLAATLGGAAAAQTPVPFNRTPDYQSDVSGVTTGGAFCDLDRDGWPDLVVANGNDIRRQRVAVYMNRKDGTFPVNPDWQSSDIDYHGHLDVGDVDGDGWPDLVVAVFLGPNGFGDRGRAKLYLNDGTGRLGGTPAWSSADTFFSFSVALGDVDNDGDLDLAVATGEPYYDPADHDRVYLNTGGTFSAMPSWRTAITTHSMDVAWCDVDRDGDMDLAFVGAKGPNRIYLNQGGALPTAASWASTDGGGNHNGNSCAFGDVDGDGRLDFAVSDNSQLAGGRGTFRVYRNLGSTFTTTPWWESARFHNGYTSALDFLDFDRDGDLDLVGGGWWTATSWYRNSGGSLPTVPTWETAGTSVVEALFFADVNCDGLRRVQGEGKTVGAGRKLFGFDHGPVQSLERVVADGRALGPGEYAFHREGGVLCLKNAPTGSLTLDYTWSEASDLGVTNWDSSKGNYVFLRVPLVRITVTPPTKTTFRGGELVVWSEAIDNTAMSPQFGLYSSSLELPGGLGTLPWIRGGAVLPGAFQLPAFGQLLSIPSQIPPMLLGSYTYRVEILGANGRAMSRGQFGFTLVP